MPEWIVERGIGETRAVLVDGGAIIAAQVELEDAVPAGSVLDARLIDPGANKRNALARDAGGNEYLLPRGAPGVSEGAAIRIEVTREAGSGEHWKRALARVVRQPPRTLPSLAERLGARELGLPAPADELGQAGWNDLVEQARTGIIPFAGGQLQIAVTPAMTLIDVDGFLEPEQLAIAGAGEAAKAVRRLDIGGSIGIDLPTAGSKAARQAAAAGIDAALPQPFERTAVNGFGFVQIVRPRTRPSLLDLAQDRPAFEARALLRLAAFEPPGAKRLVAHPAVAALLETRQEWLDALASQVGGAVSLRADAGLPMSGGYAEQA